MVITDASGIAVGAVGPGLAVGEDFATRPEVAAALEGRTSQGERYSDTLGEELLYVAVPVLGGPRALGAVRITNAAVDLEQRVQQRERGLLLAALITLAISVVVALLLAGNVTRRLRLLEDAIQELADGDLSARADAGTGAKEIRSLAGGFNTMATRLEALVDAQRSFAGDASHQLRTPLTALRLRLDQASELVETDPAAAQARLEAATAETDRLARLVEGLLVLARSEGATVNVEPVDVADVARERVSAWEPLAAERDVRIDLTAPRTAPALAVEGAVEQILDNYVDNAVEVSPPGSVIAVSVVAAARRCRAARRRCRPGAAGDVAGPRLRPVLAGSAGLRGHRAGTGDRGAAGPGRRRGGPARRGPRRRDRGGGHLPDPLSGATAGRSARDRPGTSGPGQRWDRSVT